MFNAKGRIAGYVSPIRYFSKNSLCSDKHLLCIDTPYKGRQNFCLHDGPNYFVFSETENVVEYSELHCTSFETHVTLSERLQTSECLDNCDVV
jgi:hypothetical protein